MLAIMHSNLRQENCDPDRVRRRTIPAVNRRIDEEIEKSIRHYIGQPRPVITRRIHRLEEEWDIERVLETNASSLSLLGLTLGLVGNRKWLIIPVAVAGFLLLHGVQGWCPPVPVLRRAGVRTRAEIDRERFALKYLRGDFSQLQDNGESGSDRAAVLVEALRR
jgi:hypothetical protein